MTGSAAESVGVTSSEKAWSFITGLFSSWAIYLCTGLSSVELVKHRSCAELVIAFAITSGEMLAPWSLLFQYFGASNLLFVTTILDLVPYMVWMWHFLFKSTHTLEIKCYCTVALVFELKVSAFLSLTFGERGILYIRTCGILRIIACISELLLDDNWNDVLSNMGPVKICRMLTIVSAVINTGLALNKIFGLWGRIFNKVQSQKLSPLGGYTSNELYGRLAMTFASIPVGTEALEVVMEGVKACGTDLMVVLTDSVPNLNVNM